MRYRGQWQPVTLLGRDTLLLLVWFLCAAAVRALDYATGHDASPIPSTVERAMPVGGIIGWAVILAIGVATTVTGMIGRWWRVVVAGHVLLAIAYTALTAGLTVEYLGRPALDGIRNAIGVSLPVVFHTLCVVRTVWKNRDREGRT